MFRSGLRWEKATITECKTDNSAHAEEHSACLLYFLDFEGGSPSCWDSLAPSDPMSCVFALRQAEVIDAPKKTTPAKRIGITPKKAAPAGNPPTPREHDWWKRFKV